MLASTLRSAGLSGAFNGQERKQTAGNALQIALSDLESAAQKSASIPSTPSNRSRDPLNCPMSSSPDSLLSSSSTMVMTPRTAASHSPASSTSSFSGKQCALPSWRIDSRPLAQPNFDGFKVPDMPHTAFSKQSTPHSGQEAVEDVFYSPNGFEQQRRHNESWQSTMKGPLSSPGSVVQQTKPLKDDDIIIMMRSYQANPQSDDDIFMIEH